MKTEKEMELSWGSELEKINGLTSLPPICTHPRSDPAICTRGGPNANRSFLGHLAEF